MMKVGKNDERFDKLVDGELGEDDRRALLSELDAQPDGWRRCALAFLEAQAWKKSFGEMGMLLKRDGKGAAAGFNGRVEDSPRQDTTGQTVGGRPFQPTEKRPQAKKSPWVAHAGTFTAMAASFLVALWLGSAAHRIWTGQPVLPSGNSVAVESGNHSIGQGVGPGQSALAQNQAMPSGTYGQSAIEPPAGRPGALSEPYQMVRLSAPSAGPRGSTSFNVPAVERQQGDDQWASAVPPAMPDDVRQAFQRLGHQVEQQRELVTVPLNGNRQLVVPVDKVKVNYVGNKVY